MGSRRIAQVLARAGLELSATTVRRIIRERTEPTGGEPALVATRRPRIRAKRPGDVWHLDLTSVPTRCGSWVPWFPFSLPQRWPLSWCVAVVIDQASRLCIGFAVFRAQPTSEQIQRFLERAVARSGHSPRHIITDKGTQFWCRGFKRWCKRNAIRVRYGVLGEPASLCIIERFIRSLKDECTRRLLLPPLLHGTIRRELEAYASWYNTIRPHVALWGRTPREVFENRRGPRRRFETRPRWPTRAERVGAELMLDVSYHDGRSHLPVVGLRPAA